MPSVTFPGPGGHAALRPESVKFSLVSLDLETFNSSSNDSKPKIVMRLSMYIETSLPIDLANEIGRRKELNIVEEVSKRPRNWLTELQISIQGGRFPFRQGTSTSFKYL